MCLADPKSGKFLILATVALAHGRPSDSETRSFVPSNLCPPDQSHWLLPHEYDCTKFYYCEYGLKWETPRDCALGTEFSFEIQVCVHPAQANCNLPGSPPTEAEPTTTTPEPTTTTTTPEPTTTTSTPEPTTTTTTPEPTTTTPEPTTTTTTPEPTTTTTTPEPTTTTTTPEPTTTTTTPEPTTTTPEPTTTTTTPEPTTTTTTPEPTTTTTTPEPTTTTTTPEPTTTTTTPEPTTTTTTPEPTTTTTTPEPTTTTTTTTTTQAPTTTTTPEPTTTTPEPTTTTTTPEPTTTTTTQAPTTTTQAPTTTPEPTTTTTTQAPNPDLLPNGCPADFEVHQLLPHTNCSKFYYCNFGDKVERECAPGTHFNPVEQVCDWPWNAGCESAGDNGNGDGDNGSGDNGNEDNGNEDGGNGDTLPNGCPSDFEVHQLLPHANCNKFYQCNFGEKIERECAPGTHFNPVKQVCDWPWNAGCESAGDNGNGDGDNGSGDNGSGDNGSGDNGNEDGDNGSTLPNGCPTDFEVHQLLPHVKCNKFYQCNFGEKIERECAPGTHFNPVKQVCDWPWNAGCESAGDNGNGDGDNGSGDNGSGDGGNEDGGNGDTLPNGCPADFEIHQLLPHANCNKFYQCNFGEKVERECAPGTHFNPDKQVCDWPWNAGCESAGDNGNGDGDNGSGDNGSGDNGSGDNGNEDGGNGDTLPNGCPADFEIHQLLPHANCNKFYQCNFGEKVERECAPGTHFNPDKQVCDWPWNAGCESAGDNGNGDGDNGSGDNGSGDNGSGDNGNEDGGNGDTLPNGCPADFEIHQLLPHANCNKFYQCNFGEKVERECAPGTHFNPDKQVCDWPWNAGCESAGDNGNGDGDNGDGDNGDGDNGNGDNGDGDSGDGDIGDGDNGDGDNGDGDNGDGDNGDGDNGSGDNGDGDNGVGDNGSGDNGDGDNGSGDNGSGDNGSGDNGSGDNGSGDNGSGDNGNEGILPNGCPADFNVNQLLPHANCSKFYYCIYGEKVEAECAAGTHFNPVEQVCDWPWNAGCDDNGNGEGEGEDGGDNGDGDNGDGDNGDGDNGEGDNGDGDDGDGDNGDGDNGDGDNGSGDNGSGDGGTEDNGNGDGGNGDGGNGDGSVGNDNKCKEECNILPWAHDTDCDKFWRCDGVKAVLVICSEGLHFNAQTATCDFICNANCERDEIQSTAEASGLNLFIPWDKVDNEIKHILEKHH